MVTCEKVIFDQAGTPSLIGIFQRLNFVQPPDPMQENAVIPFPWSVYTVWDRVGEGLKEATFSQMLQVLKPNGEVFLQNELPFTLPEDEAQARNSVNIFGFPIAQSGDLTVKISLREQPELEHKTAVKIDHLSHPVGAALAL